IPSTWAPLSPASSIALRMASTAIARVLRFDWRLYSVSPTPTMQYRSLSPAMRVSLTPRLRGGRASLAGHRRPVNQGGFRRPRARRPREGEHGEGDEIRDGADPAGHRIAAEAVVDPSRAQGAERGGGPSEPEDKADERAGMGASEEVRHHGGKDHGHRPV